jgi:large subunit ribosomal protein L4
MEAVTSSLNKSVSDDFISIDVHDALSGEKKGQIKVEKSFFSAPNKNLLWYYIRWYLAGKRAGTHETKTISTVSGSGRKPWLQKHTGRARQGFIRNPHWVGGAVAHGPHPRDYSFKMNKKEKKEALRSAIASKFIEGKLKIIDELNFDSPQTKKATEIIRNLEAYPLILITDGSKKNVLLSFRAVQLSRVLPVDEINAYEILKYDFAVFEKNAFLKILQRYNVKVEEK